MIKPTTQEHHSATFVFIAGSVHALMAQTVRNLPAIRKTWLVQSLGWEDPLEEGMATHSSIAAWRIPRDSGAWWATVHGVAKSRTQLSNWARHSTPSPTPRTYEPSDTSHLSPGYLWPTIRASFYSLLQVSSLFKSLLYSTSLYKRSTLVPVFLTERHLRRIFPLQNKVKSKNSVRCLVCSGLSERQCSESSTRNYHTRHLSIKMP